MRPRRGHVLACSFRVVLSAAVVATCAGSARADSAPADDAARRAARQFVEGQQAFTAGDFRRAAELFEGAYRDKPHHSVLWNAARSWHKAGEEVRAANYYARFLQDAPANAPDRDQANVAVRELATRMGRIELHGAGVTRLRLDGKEPEAAVVYVAAGEHLAEADSEKGPVRKVVRVDAGQIVSVTLERPKDPEAPRADVPAESRGLRVLSPAVFVGGAALTAVGGAAAVVSGLDTVSKRDAFLEAPSQGALDDGFASQSRTNVAIGVTVGLAVVTAVIGVAFTDWKGSAGATSSGRAARAGLWRF